MVVFIIRVTSDKSLFSTNTFSTLPLLEFTNEISIIALMAGHIAEAIWNPPERWPDIFVLWNLTVCWGCFCVYWGWLVCGFWKDDFNLMMNRYGKEKKKVQ